MGVHFPSQVDGQKGRQKALYAAYEHKQKQPPGRQISVNQLNFIPEYNKD